MYLLNNKIRFISILLVIVFIVITYKDFSYVLSSLLSDHGLQDTEITTLNYTSKFSTKKIKTIIKKEGYEYLLKPMEEIERDMRDSTEDIFNKKIGDIISLEFEELEANVGDLLVSVGISEKLLKFCKSMSNNSNIDTSHFFEIVVPKLLETFGKEFVKENWDDFLDLGIVAKYNTYKFYIFLTYVLPAFVEKFGIEFVKDKWKDVVKIGIAAGRQRFFLFRDGLNSSKWDEKFVKENWHDFIELALASGEKSRLLFSPDFGLLKFVDRSKYGWEGFKKNWSDIVYLGIKAKEKSNLLFSDALASLTYSKILKKDNLKEIGEVLIEIGENAGPKYENLFKYGMPLIVQVISNKEGILKPEQDLKDMSAFLLELEKDFDTEALSEIYKAFSILKYMIKSKSDLEEIWDALVELYKLNKNLCTNELEEVSFRMIKNKEDLMRICKGLIKLDIGLSDILSDLYGTFGVSFVKDNWELFVELGTAANILVKNNKEISTSWLMDDVSGAADFFKVLIAFKKHKIIENKDDLERIGESLKKLSKAAGKNRVKLLTSGIPKFLKKTDSIIVKENWHIFEEFGVLAGEGNAKLFKESLTQLMSDFGIEDVIKLQDGIKKIIKAYGAKSNDVLNVIFIFTDTINSNEDLDMISKKLIKLGSSMELSYFSDWVKTARELFSTEFVDGNLDYFTELINRCGKNSCYLFSDLLLLSKNTIKNKQDLENIVENLIKLENYTSQEQQFPYKLIEYHTLKYNTKFYAIMSSIFEKEYVLKHKDIFFKLGIEAGAYAKLIFKKGFRHLRAIKIENPKGLETVGQLLIKLVKQAGTDKADSFLNDLLYVQKLIKNKDSLEKIGADIIELREAYGIVDDGLFSRIIQHLLSMQEPNFDFLKIKLDLLEFFKSSTLKDRENILNYSDIENLLDDFEEHNVNLLDYLHFYNEIFKKKFKNTINIFSALSAAINLGIVDIKLEKEERANILEFLDETGIFSPYLYKAYKTDKNVIDIMKKFQEDKVLNNKKGVLSGKDLDDLLNKHCFNSISGYKKYFLLIEIIQGVMPDWQDFGDETLLELIKKFKNTKNTVKVYEELLDKDFSTGRDYILIKDMSLKPGKKNDVTLKFIVDVLSKDAEHEKVEKLEAGDELRFIKFLIKCKEQGMLDNISTLDYKTLIILENDLHDPESRLMKAFSAEFNKGDNIYTYVKKVLSKIRNEKKKYNSKTIEEHKLEFRVLKIPLWGQNAGVCTGDDVDLWGKDNFYTLAIIDKTIGQIRGFVSLYEEEVEGERVLVVTGIDPSTELLSYIRVEPIYTMLIRAINKIRKARKCKYTIIPLLDKDNIASNRIDIRAILIKQLYKLDELKETINWNKVPNEMPIKNVYKLSRDIVRNQVADNVVALINNKHKKIEDKWLQEKVNKTIGELRKRKLYKRFIKRKKRNNKKGAMYVEKIKNLTGYKDREDIIIIRAIKDINKGYIDDSGEDWTNITDKTLDEIYGKNERALYIVRNRKKEILCYAIVDKQELDYIKAKSTGKGAGTFLIKYILNELSIISLNCDVSNKAGLKFYDKFDKLNGYQAIKYDLEYKKKNIENQYRYFISLDKGERDPDLMKIVTEVLIPVDKLINEATKGKKIKRSLIKKIKTHLQNFIKQNNTRLYPKLLKGTKRLLQAV